MSSGFSGSSAGACWAGFAFGFVASRWAFETFLLSVLRSSSARAVSPSAAAASIAATTSVAFLAVLSERPTCFAAISEEFGFLSVFVGVAQIRTPCAREFFRLLPSALSPGFARLASSRFAASFSMFGLALAYHRARCSIVISRWRFDSKKMDSISSSVFRRSAARRLAPFQSSGFALLAPPCGQQSPCRRALRGWPLECQRVGRFPGTPDQVCRRRSPRCPDSS